MASKRREKRARETAEELDQALAREAADAVVASRADDALFVVDRTGSKSARRRIVKEQAVVASNKPVSKTERILLKKMEENGGTLRKGKTPEIPSQLQDLWADDDSDGGGGGASVAARRRVKTPNTATIPALKRVAGPGFSYNPTPEAHQEILAEALALEIKKKEKDLREARAAKSQKGLQVPSALVQSVLVESGDEDDEDDEDDDDAKDAESKTGRKKKLEKKTQAQRNKERRRKDADQKLTSEQRQKQMLKTISQLPVLLKQAEAEERKAKALRELREIKALASADDSALSYDESGSVPLSDELSGSLRRIIPKGSTITNAVAKLKTTGAIQFRDKLKRKKGDTLNKTKKVKWVAKYKYP
jgi:Nop53 (60S ribosomal biogenesis)